MGEEGSIGTKEEGELYLASSIGKQTTPTEQGESTAGTDKGRGAFFHDQEKHIDRFPPRRREGRKVGRREGRNKEGLSLLPGLLIFGASAAAAILAQKNTVISFFGWWWGNFGNCLARLRRPCVKISAAQGGVIKKAAAWNKAASLLHLSQPKEVNLMNE